MNRLILALALAPALLATGAKAQTVSDAVAENLWCGEAFSVYFDSQKAGVPAEQQATFQAYVDASVKLVDMGVQGYLDAGFTEEQVAKLKTDLVAEVTPVVTTQSAKGKYTPDDCGKLLDPLLVLPTPPSDASAAPDASTPPADASSSAAQ